MKKVPVIDITDMYHPYQDPGDNVDILNAFALPEIDLRAVILDITDEYRKEYTIHPEFGRMDGGPREPGIVTMCQCNRLFGRHVPYGIGPFERLKSETDTAKDQSPFHNGPELLLKTLRESDEPVHILSFGSARVIAAAFNRDPETMLKKTAMVHISAGSSGEAYREWNVQLDPHAYARVLRSGLPIAIYPCATEKGPFDIGQFNTFWKLPNKQVFLRMDAPLRRYMQYVFTRSTDSGFLSYLENDRCETNSWADESHNVWETAIWMQVAGRELVYTEHGHRYLPQGTGKAALREELLPCRIDVKDGGLFTFEITAEPTNTYIYHRDLPNDLDKMLTEAYEAEYLSFKSVI